MYLRRDRNRSGNGDEGRPSVIGFITFYRDRINPQIIEIGIAGNHIKQLLRDELATTLAIL